MDILFLAKTIDGLCEKAENALRDGDYKEAHLNGMAALLLLDKFEPKFNSVINLKNTVEKFIEQLPVGS